MTLGLIVRCRVWVCCGAVLVCLVCWGVVGPGAAHAAPAWRITAETAPSAVPAGGTGLFLLRVDNIGDSPSVAGLPVTVVDRLPAGIAASEAAGLQVDSFTFAPEKEWGKCTISEAGRLVTCALQTGDTVGPISMSPVTISSQGAGPGLLAPPIGIAFSAEPAASGTLVDKATVSGGGSVSGATVTSPVDIGSSTPFGLSSFHMWSTNIDGTIASQAGSHPYEMTTSLMFNDGGNGKFPVGVVRNLQIALPPGFVGNPDAIPKCSRPAFDVRLSNRFLPDCPPDSQVGVAVLGVGANFLAQAGIYNLVPPSGVPVQFGVAISKFVGFIDGEVRPGPGGVYNLGVNSSDVQSNGVLGVNADLWGAPSMPLHNPLRYSEGRSEEGLGAASNAPQKPFLRLPTSCGTTQTLSVSAVSWENPMAVAFSGAAMTDEENEPVVIGGCSKLDFSPSIKAESGTSVAESPAGLAVGIALPQNEDLNGLSEADVKNVSVTLPEGMTVSPSAANGLEACSEEQLGVSGGGPSLLFNESPVECPAASKLGTVEVTTPLLEHPLQGALYIAQQEANPFNSLVALYLVAEGSGVLVKRAGEVHLNQQTGQISVTFQNNPQVPLSEIKVDTFQNARSSLMTPSSCGAYSLTTSMTAWNGGFATPSSEKPFSVSEGCSDAFSPSFTAGTTNNQAGAFSPFSVTFSRQDGEQRIANGSALTPPGLSAILKGVQRCPEPQASNGTCGPESQIGHATIAVGPGPEPFYAPANVFFTGPYGGAPFGLSIVARAKAGPFDLGNVIVRARIDVDPHTAQIVVTPDSNGPFAVPTILKGIPLDLRVANVTIDRPNFVFNPTNCSRSAVSGVITSTGGTNAAVSSPFQATGCAKLPFKPTFTVSTQAKTSKADGASLTLKITKKAGEANLHKADLQLPIALPARLTTLQKACTEAQFNANPAKCPPASVIGTAKVITPILNVPVTGPAILVSHGGAAFPDVEFVLQGEGVTVILDGATDIKKGITYSKFETAPDQPFSSFETRLPEGPYSVLATNIPATAKGSLCGQSLTMPTVLVGQNETQFKQTTKIGVSGCPKAKKTAASLRRKSVKSTRRTKK
jgi:hypothetical protein